VSVKRRCLGKKEKERENEDLTWILAFYEIRHDSLGSHGYCDAISVHNHCAQGWCKEEEHNANVGRIVMASNIAIAS
jgi:hypothetical protein